MPACAGGGEALTPHPAHTRIRSARATLSHIKKMPNSGKPEFGWARASENAARLATHPSAVIAGLDPAIDEDVQQYQSYVRLSLAAKHHGCPGQARA
jgi:hypothetical protein